MVAYSLSPAARSDLIDIQSYIARRDPQAAGRLIDRIEEACRTLADTPGLGHSRSDLTGDLPVKLWPVRRYLIVYRGDAPPIEIVRVFSGYRDIAALLG